MQQMAVSPKNVGACCPCLNYEWMACLHVADSCSKHSVCLCGRSHIVTLRSVDWYTFMFDVVHNGITWNSDEAHIAEMAEKWRVANLSFF